MNKPSFGVIVGRFQVHELHDGHLELFRAVGGRHSRVLVFLGCTKVGPTKRNPLDFETRKKMIESKFPSFTILPLQDKKTDEEWSRELDNRIDDAVGGVPAEIVLYGARDSFVPSYHGRHSVVELTLAYNLSGATVSGTDIRNKLTNEVMEDSKFRAGQIYAMNQMYPRVIPVVDIAPVYEDNLICLGRKPGEKLLRFPGGFAERTPAGEPYAASERDALRELMEETGLDVSAPLEYIGSCTIEEWRFNSADAVSLRTTFFYATVSSMSARAGDDLFDVAWIELDSLKPEIIEPEHRPLLFLLKNFLNHKQKEESLNA